MGRQDPGSGPVQGLELEQGIGVDDGGQGRFAEQTTY